MKAVRMKAYMAGKQVFFLASILALVAIINAPAAHSVNDSCGRGSDSPDFGKSCDTNTGQPGVNIGGDTGSGGTSGDDDPDPNPDDPDPDPDDPDPDPDDPDPDPDDPDPGPSADDIAAAVAAALEEAAAEQGISIDELSAEAVAAITESATQSAYNLWNEANERAAEGCGDPVLATTGRYMLETADTAIPGSSFEINRVYVSEGAVTGSFGAGWAASTDSRIIRGASRVSETAIAEIEGLLAQILGAYNSIERQYTLAGVIATRIYNNTYLPALAKLESLRAIKARGEELSALNRRALFPGTPDYYEGVGNERLTLVDENGAPQAYEPAGRGVWVPTSYPERLYERIESRDGRGAETRAGFIYYGRGGITREYDGDGLLTKVTELDGNSIEILRDERGHITRMEGPHGAAWDFTYAGNLITRIQGPEGEELRYGYSGNELSWAQDGEGDLARYAYEGGRLKEIIKPDGSSIKLEYGLAGEGGAMLVTATAHEEGAVERFEYFPSQGITRYTNHSGVITQYRYDGQHRTTEELHGSGLTKTYGYNGQGQLAWERINGFEIRYGYDARGNISEKTYGDGTRERLEYNGKDQLTRYTDRDGITTEWIYDSRGNCVEIRRGGVQIFAGAYDERNRLVSSREGDMAETRYGYDSRDFPVMRAITIDGQEIREYWEYDGLGRVTKYTDGAGREWKYRHAAKETIETTPTGLEIRYITNERKDLVRVIEKDLATGEVRELSIAYDRRHLPVEVRDGAGNITRYEYREDGELVRKEQGPWHWEYAYEAGGRISAMTHGKEGTDGRYTESYGYAWQAGGAQTRTITLPGAGSTAYGINAFGQATSVTNALGETATRTVNGAGNSTREQAASGGYYEYRYDGLGRLAGAGREGESGIQAQYNRDGSLAQKTDRLGNVTRYAYDGRGLLAREITELGEERYYYDLAGRLTRQETISRNSNAYYTEWAYDDHARTVTITLGGAYTQTLYLNAWGEVIRTTDGEGNERRYEYDGSGQLAKSIDGYGRQTRYEWNEIGKIAKIAYADNTSIEYEYDHLGNLTRITDALGISWAGEYDGAGRLKREQGRPGIDREYRYDLLGRIIEVKSGGEVIESYRYTERGREAIFIDGQGNNFAQQKNVYGELTVETNRLNDRQSYAYDAEGRVVGITAYSGKQTRIEYRDSEGLTITAYSDGSRSIIERDKAGNIIRISSETGTVRYRYDAGGRLIEQNDEGAGEVTRYAYDRAGRRVRMASGNRDVRYQYGKNGELVRVTDAAQRLEARYEYDARGRETLRIYGNGVRQETAYDAAGRVILIKETDSMNRLLRAEAYVYDDKGRRSYSADEEGKVTKYEYDNQSRLVTVLYSWTREKSEADRKEAEEAGLYFTPDKGTGERYTIPPAEMAALRNALNRAAPLRGNAIVQSQMMWRETYTYDLNGNRATKTTPWGTIEYEYDEENRLLRRGDIVYTNDMDGNVLSERGLRYEAHYEYNGQNRMTYSETTSHVDMTHAISFYAYDALGRRTLTEGATGQALRTVYDGFSFEVIREGEAFRDGSLTTQYSNSVTTRAAPLQSGQPTGERYRWISEDYNGNNIAEDGYAIESSRYGTRGVTLYGNGEAVAVSYSSSTTSRSVYLGKDILGSVRTATTDSGAVEDRYEYDAFGQVYKGDLSGGMNLGYTGKPYDAGTGLYNYGYRDYRPQAARFTTADPIRDGNNWYAYVNNDPVNYIDLWGLDMQLIIYNIDPTPGANEIISQSGDVGHTWVSVDGIHYGWGGIGDPSSGNTIPGDLLNTYYSNAGDRTVTSTYSKTVTDAQGQAIIDYFTSQAENGTGYNLGGSAAAPRATMCTESVVNALNDSGALTPAEWAIINAPYAPWVDSFPTDIPQNFQAMAPSVENLTLPNPNAFEDRIRQLNNKNN